MPFGRPVPSPSFHSFCCVHVFTGSEPLLLQNASTSHLTSLCVQSLLCTWKINLPCALFSPNTRNNLLWILETLMKVCRDRAFTRAMQVSLKPHMVQAFQPVHGVILVPPSPIFSLLRSPNLIFLMSSAGQFNFLSCFLLSCSLPPTTFALTAYQSFSQYTPITQGEF